MVSEVSLVRARVFSEDLSRPAAAQRLHEAVTRAGLTVDLLVNNAGSVFRADTRGWGCERLHPDPFIIWIFVRSDHGLDLDCDTLGHVHRLGVHLVTGLPQVKVVFALGHLEVG